MGQPRKTIRSVNIHLMLPEDLVGEISLLLYSELQGRIPLGALSKFHEQASRELLAKMKGETNGLAAKDDGV